MASDLPESASLRTVRVWDVPTRLFHWLTVALAALLMTTAAIIVALLATYL